MEDPDVARYMEKLLRKVYAQWKHELHKEYNMFGSADEALASPPPEMAARLDQWQWLCTHFQSPEFLVCYIILGLQNYFFLCYSFIVYTLICAFPICFIFNRGSRMPIFRTGKRPQGLIIMVVPCPSHTGWSRIVRCAII